jgi:uncharacterized protein (TIGR02266 family)
MMAMPGAASMSVATRGVQDRRDSPRVPFSFRVRCALEAQEFEQSSGDLSTGGVFWAAGHPVPCRDVEVRVTLPGHDGEIEARGEIVGSRERQGSVGFHVRFVELSTEGELAIARYIDEVVIGWE